MALPSDPIMLLSDALCKALSAVGYAYDAARNQFI